MNLVTKRVLIFAAGILIFTALTYYVPLLSISEIIYPARIDSSFIQSQNQKLIAEANANAINPVTMVYHPSQVGIHVQGIEVKTKNNLILHGWFYDKPVEPTGNAVLVIHNISESKILWMETCWALSELGFYVFCFDLPAHGTSEGEIVEPGNSLLQSLEAMTDSVFCFYEINHFSIIASGANCFAATKFVLEDRRPEVLVLQNPVGNFSDYLLSVAQKKWGMFANPVFPLAKQRYRQKTGVDADSLNLSLLIRQVTKPLLVSITKENPDEKTAGDALQVFENCASPVKKMWTEKSKGFLTNMYDEEKNYYRALAAFINSNTPKKSSAKRNKKKIAFN